jgi:hypothetical protein
LTLTLRLDAPNELTTAATDVLLAALCLWCAAHVARHTAQQARLVPWRAGFLLMAFGALAGGAAHALHVPEQYDRLVWAPIYLALSLAVACFLLGVIHDTLPDRLPRLRPIVLGLGLACFAVATAFPDYFAIFLAWQGFVMLVAIGGYGVLWHSGRLAGSGWICIGLLISVAAAVIQATRALSFTLIWPFDHNSVFHLVQLPGLVAIAHGLVPLARCAARS